MNFKQLFRPYILIGVGSIVFIIASGMYFNWPHDKAQAINRLAPEFIRISGYVNNPGGKPITLAEQHGSVVLLHFFRIGCEECQKDVNFVNSMYAKYAPYGLKVIGVHSALYDYEQQIGNVENFARDHGIKFPIVM